MSPFRVEPPRRRVAEARDEKRNQEALSRRRAPAQPQPTGAEEQRPLDEEPEELPETIGKERDREMQEEEGGRGGGLADRKVRVVIGIAILLRIGFMPLVVPGVDVVGEEARAGDAVAQVLSLIHI